MTAKRRPCKKGCGYPAIKGRQFCRWHVLLRMSSDEQARMARGRLAAYDHTGGHQDRRMRVPPSEWPDGERWCAGCQSFVPLFYCSGSRCKACASASSHAKRLEDNYGITPAEYDRIFLLQGRRCAICRNRPRTIRFAVDHDHKTGENRGILCKRCNHDLLGGAHDDVLVLYRAIEYLLYPPAQVFCPDGATDPRPSREVVLARLDEYLTLVALRNQPKLRTPQEPPPF